MGARPAKSTELGFDRLVSYRLGARQNSDSTDLNQPELGFDRLISSTNRSAPAKSCIILGFDRTAFRDSGVLAPIYNYIHICDYMYICIHIYIYIYIYITI